MKDYSEIENRLQKHYDGLLSAVKTPDTTKKPNNKKSSKWEDIKDFFNSTGMQVAAAALALVFTVGGVYGFIFFFSGKNINSNPITPDTSAGTETSAENTDKDTAESFAERDVTSEYDAEDVTTDAETETELTMEETTGTEPETDTETETETEKVTETETEKITETETEKITETEKVTETETEKVTEKETVIDPQDDTEETEEIPVTETDPQDDTDPPETAEPYGYEPAYVQISCGK